MIKEKQEGERGRQLSCPHGEEMKRKTVRVAFFLAAFVFIFSLSGCRISFSDRYSSANKADLETESTALNGAIVAENDRKIVMKDITLILPDGMKYGMEETDAGKVYYVWNTEKDYIFPTDSDVIFYAYEGMDAASPDKELTDSEARYSIVQTYMQMFQKCVNGKTIPDPSVVSNTEWYTLQFTGYSGDYIMTSYGTMCYPKYYYGVYMLQKVTDNFSRNYYGFIFSNDNTGAIMSEAEYNDIYWQIKKVFAITEFYTAPQLNYDEATDYSKGYSYKQIVALFADTANYYGMNAQNQAEGATELPELTEMYKVIRVVDGDTIIVSIDGKEVRVRLIGIDTPESVSTYGNENTKEGKEVSDYVTEQLTGKSVYLEYDKRRIDTYGRTLAYVYLEDGKTMLNKVLIERGYAQVMIVEPNTKYMAEFEKLEAMAENSRLGFWGTGFFKGDND